MNRLVLFAITVSGLACVRAEFSPSQGHGGGGGGGITSCQAPSLCAPQGSGGVCDPVCQTGSCDWCKEKCSAAGDDGTPVCSANGAQQRESICEIFNSPLHTQYDTCAAGTVCVTPERGGAVSYCFRFCRSRGDCLGTNVECAERDLSPTVKVRVCDPDYKSCSSGCCNPFDSSTCPSGRFCYLVSPDTATDTSRTVCEYATGGGLAGEPCSSARKCQEGYACVNGLCAKVCNDGHPCPTGTCTPLGKPYGYCAQ